MITIPATIDVNGVQSPKIPIPANAVTVVCDGSTYTVYQPGDAVPVPVPSQS